ncbi:hypothetical protein PC41400_26450 [Paenibacillus chitinolyticus]|uniref:Uncharacterized protein n=1 Tax=Paenibacillus chitinolyticus TaxID=79263 RepID=A0A410X330_9BACL|nr:hypothetical protein [Paenibacillus chitinolyticus]MCY9588918.1 hypothetical protein [Paenibacillus chitinolyticus]MCY9597771.1 hypothetical protein [Paenibacillus chitinolyticus]QAV21019.1 hypothetical protein PC41400_26450 [Paenibacillus chitinolyticus]
MQEGIERDFNPPISKSNSNKMRAFIRRSVFVLPLVAALSACSVTHSVETDTIRVAAKSMKKNLKGYKGLYCTFTRPDVTCRVDWKGEPDPETHAAVLAAVKAFVTPEHMREIARSVKWNLEISEFHLLLNTDDNKADAEHAYSARYYKTSDASDDSEANIDAYKTWTEDGAQPVPLENGSD